LARIAKQIAQFSACDAVCSAKMRSAAFLHRQQKMSAARNPIPDT